MPNSSVNSFPQFYIDPPYNLLGGAGWILLVVCVVYANWRFWEVNKSFLQQRWMVFVGLILAAPVLAILFPIKIPFENILPIPGVPTSLHVPVLFILAGLPLVLAAGLFEPVWACAIGGLTGLMIGLYQTHHFFTMVEYAGLATLFSAAVRQRYRTRLFTFLRHPLGAALFLACVYAPVYILSSFFATNGEVVARLDYAITQTWPIMVARGVELVIASLVVEVILLARVPLWGRLGPLVPSPLETSLQLRFFVNTFPFVFLLVLTLIIGDWMVAGKVAREMIQSRMENTAQVATDSLPYFLETGQNLLVSLAVPELYEQTPEQARSSLSLSMRSVPYFRQLFLFKNQAQPVIGYPQKLLEEIQLSEEEKRGLELAEIGVMVQTFIVPRQAGETTVQVSFLAPIRDRQNIIKGVILGRTDLNSNPFTQPSLQALGAMKSLEGEGYILDDAGRVLFHPNPELLMTEYQAIGKIPIEKQFFEEIAGNGTRRYVYFQPMKGKNWSVILTVPAERAQRMALDIAIPLLSILIVLGGVAYLALRFSLRAVATSMKTLSLEATLISQGHLEHALQVQSVDEVGQVGRAFELMRVSLKARLEELNRLLKVSQAVAANLEAGDSVKPVLEAAMVDGTAMARVVLQPEVKQDLSTNRPAVFGVGPAADRYSYLDEQIFEMMRSQEILSITNTSRVRRIIFKSGVAQPGALIALALHHENRYMGALWMAFEQARNFSEEEIRFWGTLAGQAAIAASNASLYASAEIGRQRLEAVLVSSPEPVLVFDQEGRLLLLNAAALHVPGLVASSVPGRSVQEVVTHREMVALIHQSQDGKMTSREMTLSNSRDYFVSVSPVNAEGRPVGKICVLQDITHYKELDKLKSDFVATVSHDLRSPLTLMRGYITMLTMVGELNEQQKNYTRKIISGVENMTRLVNNLLDLGRIDAGIGLQIERLMAQDVVEQVLTSLQPQATQKSIQLLHEGLDQAPIFLEADRALFQQAIYNLVENAVKYTPTGGQIRVKLDPQVTTVVVEVRDTGIGIAPLDLPRLFERFYRSARREANTQRGTGLGLAIVKSIAERHTGKVWVESQLGKGSIFYFEVPYSLKKGENSKIELSKSGGIVI